MLTEYIPHFVGEYPLTLEALRAKAPFPLGQENTAYAQYFVGTSYLTPLITHAVPLYAVSFAPGCRNHWHTHTATKGGGQILLVTAGRGYCQCEGEEVRVIKPGDVIHIPANVKHWHGAAKDSAMQHLALEVPGEKTQTLWGEPVDSAFYDALS
ncbi:MAG: cupin domain-containing protein [Desulfovibrio sp.]|nr:cupin domain-containing protein [Desulfovibrio sp.]